MTQTLRVLGSAVIRGKLIVNVDDSEHTLRRNDRLADDAGNGYTVTGVGSRTHVDVSVDAMLSGPVNIGTRLTRL